MRILIVSNMYPSAEAPTFGIFVRNQVEALQNHGLDLTVAAIQDPRSGKIHVLRKYGQWALKTMARFSKGYDLVHAHYAFPSGWLARLHYKLRKVPYIVTVHGGDLNKMAKKGRFFRKQTENILRDAAHVIVVGPALFDEVTNEYGISPKHVSTLNMGVDRRVFHPRKDVQPPFKKDEGLHILFAGNLIKEKGMEELLQAAAILRQNGRNLYLHLAGTAKSVEYETKLKNAVKSLALEEAVNFHGPLSQKDLAVYMTHADLFVLPSHMEGFGLVALEAMACGTPVVASRVGGLPALLSDGAGTLAEPKDSNALAASMESVLSDTQLQARHVQAGLKKAENFDADHIHTEIINLYQSALAGKSR